MRTISTEKTEQELKDEEYRNKKIEDYKLFAQAMNQVVLESMNAKNKTKFYKKYTSSQVSDYLLDPSKYEKQLRDVSRYLAVSSPQYWRLITYLPSIAILKPYITPFDLDKVMKNVSRTEKVLKTCMKEIDNMSISHEFLKALTVVAREDVFYGYEIETPDSYFIKQLDPNYCRIKGKYDGCFTYEFDFSYFDTYKDELENYSSIDIEFKNKYYAFKKDSNLKWQELNSDKEVCLKFQETFDFICPPYVSVFNDLYDIISYKDMSKEKFEQEINTFIGLKMPIRDNSNKDNDFLLDGDTMKAYFAFIQSCLQGKTGLFMSPMEFEPISFGNKNSASTSNDVVNNAIKTFWNSTGVADVLFSENKNAGTLKFSLKTDEGLLFQVYRQIERFLSRKIKKLSNGMFKVTLPNLTVFNVEEVHNRALKDAQYGFNGAITLAEVTSGLSQNESKGLGFLENEVLKKHKDMIPVSSSHTLSGKNTDVTDEGGAPPKDEGDLTTSGQQSRDDSVNQNR